MGQGLDERAKAATGVWRRSGTAGAVLLAGTGAGLALTASAGASPSAAPARCAGSDPHLTVQGSGQGSGTPDVLTAVFGFSTTAGSSTAALSQNSAKVTLALQALADNGVAKARHADDGTQPLGAVRVPPRGADARRVSGDGDGHGNAAPPGD